MTLVSCFYDRNGNAYNGHSEKVVTASWYETHGHIMANGKRSTSGHSVAHVSLPLGTRLQLTDQKGVSTVVTVDDRGPAKWVQKRWHKLHRQEPPLTLDLRPKIARAFGMGKCAVGHVQVRMKVLRS